MALPVVILAGGLGTRLREETEYRPKPMVKIGTQPIIWHIMKTYAHQGFKDFIVCLGYKGEMIRQYFYDWSVNAGDVALDLATGKQTRLGGEEAKVDWNVVLADTGQSTMTGGRIKRIAPYVKAERFMVTYGDGLADIDLKALLAAHEKGGRLATLTGVRPTSRFGELSIDGDRVVHFREKEYLQETWISGGYFVFERKVFDYIGGDDTILEYESLRKLAEDGQLTVYKHPGYWQCMDTYREFEILNAAWAGGKAPWKVW
jgi:glucose-1-phosphate cytidylyltransferase